MEGVIKRSQQDGSQNHLTWETKVQSTDLDTLEAENSKRQIQL